MLIARRRRSLVVECCAVRAAGAPRRRSTAAARRRAGVGAAAGCKVGVSWNNYQEERWAKCDEPAIKTAIAAAGGTYISTTPTSRPRSS